jgi:hypothetical protein
MESAPFFRLLCLGNTHKIPAKILRKYPHILDRQREKSYDKYTGGF